MRATTYMVFGDKARPLLVFVGGGGVPDPLGVAGVVVATEPEPVNKHIPLSSPPPPLLVTGWTGKQLGLTPSWPSPVSSTQ